MENKDDLYYSQTDTSKVKDAPPYTLYTFGPILYKTSVDQAIVDELLMRGKKLSGSHVEKLAGHLDKEQQFTNDDKKWFVDSVQPYLSAYFETFQKLTDPRFYEYTPFNGVLLKDLWINFMKAGEYNPPHIHGFDFSFVFYLQIPKGLEKEKEDFKGIGVGPGSISFYYGEWQRMMRSEHHFWPKVGDFYIWPAKLKHGVPPFKSPGERISVSGNFEILSKEAGDTVIKVAKQVNEFKNEYMSAVPKN